MRRSNSYLLNDQNLLRSESSRLIFQAKLMFDAELQSLRKHGIDSSKSIVDLGCGNGFFLSLLKNNYEDKGFFGVDRNAELIEQAKNAEYGISFSSFDLFEYDRLRELVSVFGPDFFLLRYVFQHMSVDEQLGFLAFLREAKNKNARLVLMDTDDNFFEMSPECPELRELIRRKGINQASLGGDRTVGSKLFNLLDSCGYSSITESSVEYHSPGVGWDTWKDAFWSVFVPKANEAKTDEERELIKASESWLSKARSVDSSFASIKVFHVSGK